MYFPSNFPQGMFAYLFGWGFLVEVDKLVLKNKTQEALLDNKTVEDGNYYNMHGHQMDK